MRKILITLLAAVLLAAAAPAAAQATYLSKRQARATAVELVREHVHKRQWSWATWWQVERAYKCARQTESVVECDFQMVDEADLDEYGYAYGCEDTIRIRATRRWLYGTYPYEADCGYDWERA